MGDSEQSKNESSQLIVLKNSVINDFCVHCAVVRAVNKRIQSLIFKTLGLIF